MAGVEALVLGLDPELVHLGEERGDRVEAVLEHGRKDEVLAAPGVLGVVHRAHVQSGDVGPQRAQVLQSLLDRHSDRTGRVVDDHVVDLGSDRLGDRLEVLDLIGGGAVRGAGVDVDLRGALVDRPASLGRVLLGRVGDRRALVAVGDRARDRVADDHRVLEAAHGRPPPRGRGFRCLSVQEALHPRHLAIAEPEDRVDRLVEFELAAPTFGREPSDPNHSVADLMEFVHLEPEGLPGLPEGVEEPSELVVPLGGAPLDSAGDRRDELEVRGVAKLEHPVVVRPATQATSMAPGHGTTIPMDALAHTGITPCFFQGRSTRLSAAIRRPRTIVGRSRAGR